MTAQDLPLGARFVLPSRDCECIVTHQIPGRTPSAHLTFARYFNEWQESEELQVFAGHTEVVAVPETKTKG